MANDGVKTMARRVRLKYRLRPYLQEEASSVPLPGFGHMHVRMASAKECEIPLLQLVSAHQLPAIEVLQAPPPSHSTFADESVLHNIFWSSTNRRPRHSQQRACALRMTLLPADATYQSYYTPSASGWGSDDDTGGHCPQTHEMYTLSTLRALFLRGDEGCLPGGTGQMQQALQPPIARSKSQAVKPAGSPATSKVASGSRSRPAALPSLQALCIGASFTKHIC